MNVKIGAVIKRLRTENKITQDTLATAIGVTPQAISRWESEGGYPDIELLPALADFFSVSTDELLGYRLSQREEEISKVKNEISRLSEVGSVEERVAFARNALSRFPADYEIRNNLAVCLYDLWKETQKNELVKEIENLCSSVVAECKNEDVRFDAIIVLATIYRETDRAVNAAQVIDLLSPMKYCREFVKSQGIGDGNTEEYIQDEIDKLADSLGTAISNYPLAEGLPNGPSTWDKKIEMLEVSNRLYRMIYGDNLMFYHTRLSRNYWLISTYQTSRGKMEDALDSLEKMCYHAVEYDKAYINDHGKFYTSIFTDKLIYPEPGKDFHELKEHTECYHRLTNLKNKRYDAIRQDPRFVAVTEKLNEYAR